MEVILKEDVANLGHRGDVVMRRSCRSGLLLNRDELLSLVHLPSASVRSAKLKREERKTVPARATSRSLKNQTLWPLRRNPLASLRSTL